METPTVMSVFVVIWSDFTHPTGGGSCKSTEHQHVTCLHVAVMAAKPCDLELASSVEEALRSEGRHIVTLGKWWRNWKCQSQHKLAVEPFWQFATTSVLFLEHLNLPSAPGWVLKCHCRIVAKCRCGQGARSVAKTASAANCNGQCRGHVYQTEP